MRDRLPAFVAAKASGGKHNSPAGGYVAGNRARQIACTAGWAGFSSRVMA
jgi:hypothetical protein